MSKEELGKIALEVVQSPKTAAAASAVAVGTGTGVYLDKITDLAALCAAVLGVILPLVLIFVHLWNWRLQKRQLELEIAELEHREILRKDAARNSPCRRVDDPNAERKNER